MIRAKELFVAAAIMLASTPSLAAVDGKVLSGEACHGMGLSTSEKHATYYNHGWRNGYSYSVHAVCPLVTDLMTGHLDDVWVRASNGVNCYAQLHSTTGVWWNAAAGASPSGGEIHLPAPGIPNNYYGNYAAVCYVDPGDHIYSVRYNES